MKLRFRDNINHINKILQIYSPGSLLIISLIFFSGLLEGLSIISMLPFLEFFMKGNSLDSQSEISQKILNFFKNRDISLNFEIILIFFFLIQTLKIYLVFIARLRISKRTTIIGENIRVKISKMLVASKWNFLTEQSSGKISSFMSFETNRSAKLFENSCSLILCALNILIYIMLAFIISIEITLIAVFFGIIIILTMRKFFQLARLYGENFSDSAQNMMLKISDIFNLIKPLKAMNKTSFLLTEINIKIQKIKIALFNQMRTVTSLNFYQDFLVLFFISILIFYFYKYSGLNFAEIVVFIIIFYRTFNHIRDLSRNFAKIISNYNALESVMEFFSNAEKNREQMDKKINKDFIFRKIEFKNVSFYRKDELVFKKINFVILKNKITIFTGLSGTGKTTIFDLIVGFCQPDSGKALFNNEEIAKYNKFSLRNSIGYVAQDNILFDGNIYSNISLDKDPNKKFIDKYINELGLSKISRNKNLGDRGIKISGGEKQRIAIIRALYKKPQVLMLDEPTSSLDEQNEKIIFKLLKKLSKSMTIVVISHKRDLSNFSDFHYNLKNKTINKK